MKKRILKFAFTFVIVVVATISTTLSLSHEKNEPNLSLILANAEAIASSSEGGTGITIFRVCSRKSGDIHCSNRRGYRKWTINVNLRFGASGGIVCPECPDQDFDYED